MIRKRSDTPDKPRKPTAPVVPDQPIREVGDNLLIAWGDELADLDDQIEALQEAKREFYANVRDNHGKVTASALKAAQRLRRMDSEKREQAEAVDDETARILAILERPRAPRATRAREGKPVLTVVGANEIQESAAVSHRRGSTSTENVSDEISAPIPPVGAADVHSVVAEAGAAVAPAAPAEIQVEQAVEAFQPPAFLTKPPSPLRPHCRRPENCGGYGSKHCGSCLRAHEAAGLEDSA